MEKINFKTLYEKIKTNKILLPDFQRNYVWLSKGYDLPFIRSILAKLPIGNFITIKAVDTKFACKELGFRRQIRDINSDVEYLLDGQQRLTTLMLVFSNLFFEKIQEQTHNYSDLLSPSMKRRYYLDLNKADFLGLYNLKFNQNDLFTTDRLEKAITYREFDENNQTFEHPYYINMLNDPYNQDKYLDYFENRLEIPLVLLSSSEIIFEELLERIAFNRENFLKKKLNSLGVENFIKDFDFTEISENSQLEVVENFLKKRNKMWKNSVKNYLLDCLELQINELKVNGSLARAIDVYESLNQGGVDLSTFDLVVAKAAASIEHKENFENYIVERFNNFSDTKFLSEINHNFDFSDYNILKNFNILTKERELLSEVKTLILQLLTLIVNTKDDYTKVDLKYIKEKEQLNLSAKDIWENIDITIDSLCAAFILYNFKLGVKSFNKAHFKLLILVVAYAIYLLNSKNYSYIEYSNKLKFIQGFYFSAIFRGKYKSDQNEVCVTELKELAAYFNENIKPETITFLDDILNVKEYNDFETLCDNKACKKTVSESILQYILATQNTKDILTNVPLTSYNNDQVLEIHHVIPISKAKTFKENKSLRGKDHILNSVLNLAYILKESNSSISNKQPRDYITEAYTNFYIDNLFESSIINFDFNNDKIDELKTKYEVKYNNLVNSIKKKIEELTK